MTQFTDDVAVLGSLTVHGELLPRRSRTQLLDLDSNAIFNVPFERWRIHDSVNTNLPGTAAGDDLALIAGAHGTGGWYLETADGAIANTTWNARQLIRVPPTWGAGESLSLTVYGGMNTTVSDTTATIDLSAYKMDRAGGLSGSELVTTAAQSCNDLTAAEFTFALNVSTISAGDLIDLKLSAAINDAATGTVVKVRIGDVRWLVDNY